MKIRYHRTTEHSPKFRPTDDQKKLIHKKIGDTLGKASKSTSKLLKKKEKNPEINAPFQHKKRIVFDIKPSNLKGRD